MLTSIVRKFRQYFRCICILQCCTTIQEFDPEINYNENHSQSTRSSPSSPSHINVDHGFTNGYFTIRPPPLTNKFSRINGALKSEAGSTTSTQSSQSMNVKIDELESLLVNKSASKH